MIKLSKIIFTPLEQQIREVNEIYEDIERLKRLNLEDDDER